MEVHVVASDVEMECPFRRYDVDLGAWVHADDTPAWWPTCDYDLTIGQAIGAIAEHLAGRQP